MADLGSNLQAIDSAALSRLHELSIRLTETSGIPSIFDVVLEATIELARADFGDLQLLDEESGNLSIVAHRGFDRSYLDFFAGGEALSGWVSGRAVQSRTRIVVEDIAADLTWARQRDVASLVGFRAVQAMPLLRHDNGAAVGVVCTHHRAPRCPSGTELKLCDLYGRQAADVIGFHLLERQLQASRARLRAAVDLLNLGLYAWNPQTNDVVWDSRIKAMWGLPADAPVDYRLWHDRIHSNDVGRVDEAVARCVDPRGDGVYEMEYRVNGFDGIERWISTRGRTSFRGQRPWEFLGVARDVTAEKSAETRLRDSETRLAAILQQLPVGVGLGDMDGRFLLRGGLLGSMWNSMMPSQDPNQHSRWRSYDTSGNLLEPEHYPGARALRGETLAQGVDFIHTAEDGRETWVRVDAAPFRNIAGEIVGALSILQDIDAQKRTEKAMREGEERFRQFAEHSTNVLWILNVQTRQFEDVSPAYDVVFGRPRHVARNYWQDAIHPEDRDHAMAELARAIRGELVVQEYRILRPDGTLCSIRETMFPIRDDAEQIRRVGGITQDITIHDASQVYVLSEGTDPERVSQFLQRAGYSVKTFSSGAEFLNLVPVLAPGCVVFDTRELSSGIIELLRRLTALRGDLPVIVLGASTGDVAQAVHAMKAGAVDWLELPGEGDELLIAVASALADARRATEHHRDAEFARGRIAGMSERERQVLEHLLAGGTNKEIARQLAISPRTVELHRAGVMERLGVKSLPEAVLLAAAAGVRPAMSWRRLR